MLLAEHAIELSRSSPLDPRVLLTDLSGPKEGQPQAICLIFIMNTLYLENPDKWDRV